MVRLVLFAINIEIEADRVIIRTRLRLLSLSTSGIQRFCSAIASPLFLA
jgi:hypothetical protein